MGFLDTVASAANNLYQAPDTNTSSLIFFRPDALPDAQPTVWKDFIINPALSPGDHDAAIRHRRFLYVLSTIRRFHFIKY